MTKSIINKPTIILTALITIALVGLGVLSTIAAQPTMAHRDVARQMTQLEANFDNQNSLSDAQINELADKKAGLASSPQGRYTSNVQTFSMFAQFIVSIFIVIASYRYLRANRTSKRPTASTILVFTIASIASFFATEIFNHLYLAAPFHLLEFVFLLFIDALMSFVFAYIIAAILNSRYVKNHSFEVE